MEMYEFDGLQDLGGSRRGEIQDREVEVREIAEGGGFGEFGGEIQHGGDRG